MSATVSATVRVRASVRVWVSAAVSFTDSVRLRKGQISVFRSGSRSGSGIVAEIASGIGSEIASGPGSVSR